MTATTSFRLQNLLRYFGFGQKRCFHCAAPHFHLEQHSATLRLCPPCQKLLAPYIGPRCRHCGLPCATAVCPDCQVQKPIWNSLAYHGLYDGSLRDLILRLKFSGELRLARLLGEFLLQAAAVLPRPDALVPIPLHIKRLRRRGYNQTLEIARQLAKLSGLPMSTDVLERVRQGKAQELLTLEQRKLNMLAAFRASPKIQGKTVWLIDDVLTTGSTCAAAARAMLDQGAAAVHLLIVARTPAK